VAVPTDDVWLDGDAVADVDVIDTVTDLVDHPGELVTECDRHRLAVGDRSSGYACQVRQRGRWGKRSGRSAR